MRHKLHFNKGDFLDSDCKKNYLLCRMIGLLLQSAGYAASGEPHKKHDVYSKLLDSTSEPGSNGQKDRTDGQWPEFMQERASCG